MMNVQRATFNVQRSAFNVQAPARTHTTPRSLGAQYTCLPPNDETTQLKSPEPAS
jgi:hypothetical protein